MKKKIIAILLAVAMLAVAVVSGTIAYFTDTDEAENTFVVGNIDIDLHEDNALPEGDNGYAKDDDYEAWLKTQTIVPDVEIEKDVWVDNVGDNAAYVRVFIQVPAFLTPVWADGYEQEWTIVETTENDDGSVTYEIWHNGPLAANTVSSDLLTAVVMDKYTSYKDVTAGTNLIVPINVEAIQARGFKSAEEAFAALDDQKLVDVGDFVTVATVEELQAAIDAADDGELIRLTDDITGDVTATQKADIKITIDGAGFDFNGSITVDGKSSRYDTTALTIKNVNFVSDANGITTAAYINLGVSGDSNTRYTNHVTVKNCTFTTECTTKDTVAIKSYTGGDKNLKVIGCTADNTLHSLLQVTNVEEGLEIINCNVTSKNGINLNNSYTFEMSGCTFNTKGYAIRVGVNGTVNTAEKFFNISDSTLACANDDGDATIIFRDSSKFATLTLDNVVLAGDPDISGNVDGTTTIVKDGVTNAVAASSNEELEAANKKDATIVLAPGTYTDIPGLAEGVTIIGTDGVVFEDTLSGTLNNTTIKNVEIKAGNAQRWAYSHGTLVFEDCTFHATSVYAIHYDGLNGANITYKNCEIIGWVAIGSGAEHITFEGCTIKGNGAYGLIRLYSPGTIKDCTFDVSAVNTTDVFQDGIHAVDCNIDVINCTNVNGAIEDIFNISGTGTITIK